MKGKIPRIVLKHRKVAIFFILGIFVYWVIFFWNPLPSDQEMIAHFKAYRSEFDEVVRRFRYFEAGPGIDASVAWLREKGTVDLMERASIYHVTYLAPRWFPNPYKKETRELVRKNKEELKRKGVSPFYLSRKFGTINLNVVSGTRKRNRYRWNTFFYGTIWKDYVYIPEIPWMVNNYLYWPVDSSGKYISKRRISNSLNHLPRNWREFECIYKPIEPHWFLRLCNGN